MSSYIQIGDYPGYEEIIAGQTKVIGPWKCAIKSQRARIIGKVTIDQVNTEEGYKFQGDGWEPVASVGDILMQDISNTIDIWPVKPHLFSNDWKEDGDGVFSKSEGSQWTLALPPGVVVKSLEGGKVSREGDLLTLTNLSLGDFYLWPAKVVKDYVSYVN